MSAAEHGDGEATVVGGVAVLPQIDALPGAEVAAAGADGDAEAEPA
jgi:hypothetical protein